MATVVADRVVGLSVLLILTGCMILNAEVLNSSPQLRALAPIIAVVVAVIVLGVGLLWSGRFSTQIRNVASRLPLVGNIADKLLAAVAVYRERKSTIALTFAITIVTLSLNTLGFYLISQALPGEGPTLSEHFLIVPIALMSGVAPLPADTLGVLDYAMGFLYVGVTQGRILASQGLLVVMTYRVVGVAITFIGLSFYLSTRRELGEAFKQAPTFEADAG